MTAETATVIPAVIQSSSEAAALDRLYQVISESSTAVGEPDYMHTCWNFVLNVHVAILYTPYLAEYLSSFCAVPKKIAGNNIIAALDT